jgi:hypothetical protein
MTSEISLLNLEQLKHRSDADIVRLWLADRGLVAVDRELAVNAGVAGVGNPYGGYYDATTDRYLLRRL